MKILHIHPSMDSGGIEAMICALVNEMSKKHDVTLCTIFVNRKNGFENKISSRVHRASLGKVREGFSIKEIFKILRFISRGKFDVVHIHGFFYYYALSVFLLHKKVKFVYTIHSDAYQENSLWDRKLLRVKKFAFRHSLVCPVTISEASKESFERLYRVKSTLVYNGIPPYECIPPQDIQTFKKRETTKLFFHPGRITEAKNQVVLCKVFDRLIKEGLDIVLLIAGTLQDKGIWDRMQPYFSDRIIYLGTRGDVRDIMSTVDAFCLPSVWEGLPVTLLEALSVGCIPICSPVGGIPEIVRNGENGFLSSNSSADSYYDAVRLFLDCNNSQIMQMKSNCRQTFENFRIETTVKKYLSVYNR